MAAITAAVTAGAAVAGVGVSAYGLYKSGEQGNAMRNQSASQARQALIERRKQQKRVDAEVANYRSMKFTNPYEGMENVFEDLRVSTQAADFQAEQGAQQRADVLGQLRGAAGSSGIAGLAQSMANQGRLQSRQISAGLAKQEVANEMARATGAQQIQQMERSGDAMVQEAESGRQATILGAMYGQAAGANANYQQAMQNQANASMQANQMQNTAMQNFASTLASTDFSGFGGGSTGGGSTGGLGLEGGGLSNATSGRQIQGGINGPKIDQFGNTVFNSY